MSIRKNEMPPWPGFSGLVRASRMPQSASCAVDDHTFCPLIVQPSAVRSARVVRLTRSEPDPGSLNSWHQTVSAANVERRKRSCCSPVPNRRIAGPASTNPWKFMYGATAARAHSSNQIAACCELRP